MMRANVRELNGYRVIKVGTTHPRSMTGNWRDYAYEHIVVAEDAIGRPLTSDEVVHHLDGNKANNRHGNLLVMERSQHAKLHQWMAGNVVVEPKYCVLCGRTLQDKQRKYCSPDCHLKGKESKLKPSRSEVLSCIAVTNYVAAGKKYGVSDNGFRKWVKSYNITIEEIDVYQAQVAQACNQDS